MYKTQNSFLFQKGQKSIPFYNTIQNNDFQVQSFTKAGYHIEDLERKLQAFGGMEEVQEDILNQLNRNTQRLDGMISRVRTFLKMQPNIKQKKLMSHVNYSPSPIQSHVKSTYKHNNSQVTKAQKTPIRLKDRVQKALQTQEDKNGNPLKQPKYIK